MKPMTEAQFLSLVEQPSCSPLGERGLIIRDTKLLADAMPEFLASLGFHDAARSVQRALERAVTNLDGDWE